MFADLPEQVQEQTQEADRQFKQDPGHPKTSQTSLDAVWDNTEDDAYAQLLQK